MTHTFRTQLFTFTVGASLCSALAAQSDFLLTYSQTETTLSGSNGTSLAVLRPNEIAHLEYSNGPCSSLSAEKWAPRTAFHTMAGDENGDAMYWNPAIFGAIDALLEGVSATPVGGVNLRTIFWSPDVAMGAGVSAPNQLRPGDIGHIVRNSAGDGRVEYFITQEQINNALGIPLNTPIDVDAAAFQPGIGVFLSLDSDQPAMTPCGPMLIQDGAIFLIPDTALTYTPDFRIAATSPSSVFVLYTEAQVDAMVANALVTDRFGACLTQAVDTESLSFDWNGAGATINWCPGTAVWVPDLLFSVETGTGASILTTAAGGSIASSSCTTFGRTCGGGPTFGPDTGIRPTSTAVGAPSFVNSLLGTWTMRYSLEARNPVLNSSPSGLPVGATLFDINSPAGLNFIFVSFAPSGPNAVRTSSPGAPWSLFGFPDYYPPNAFYNWYATSAGTSTFPSFPIPPNFPVKLVFQSFGIVNGLIEFSTPATLDIL
ncbi:MAG: hypothetical protein KDC98_12470 [Planctomycetes bacterium]|nr:hypothetical protein [Planctomycetota bacterium]